VIREEHLRAALAFWMYCDQSARWLFEDAIGDPVADTILSALRRGGPLTRSAISDLLGHNVSRSRIERALGELVATGLARMGKAETRGRPSEVWHAN
jgi:predicted ArsR family transcriptional regulator